MASTEMRIAIFGGGFSGAMVATHLLRLATVPLSIDLIEPRPSLGAGLAYSTANSRHVLNVPARRMSAFPDDPEHFLRWLIQHGNHHADSFAPRERYGAYVRAVLETAIADAPAHARLEWIRSEASAVLSEGSSAVIRLKNGESLRADRVVLALGNFPPSDPPGADRTFYRSKHYVSHAWGPEALEALEPNVPVLLIGSGLTMLDVVLALQARDHQGVIHVISRHGLLAQAYQSHPPYPSFLPMAVTSTTLRALLRRIRREVARAAAAGHDWRAVIDALRPQIPALWQALPLAEQQRFLRHLRPYWDAHHHRVAPEAIAVLDRLRRSQQLQIHAGRIQAYQEQREGVRVAYRPRRSGALVDLQVSRIINCTGFECDYRRLRQPLIVNLLESGLIRPDPLYLGLDTDAEGRLLDAEGRASSLLHTLGPPCKGRLWETTAVPEIRGQAEALARCLLQTF